MAQPALIIGQQCIKNKSDSEVILSGLIQIFRNLLSEKNGNFGLLTAVIAVPLFAAAGGAVDVALAMSVKEDLQHNLDAAILATAHDINTLKASEIQAELYKQLQARNGSGYAYTLNPEDITVNIANSSVSAIARAKVPTSFLGLINIDYLNVAAQSAVISPLSSYVDVNIVIDKSASMLLAADSAGQSKMLSSQAGCVFACHTAEGGPWRYNGASYDTNYKLAKAMGVTLRSDVAVSAAKKVLSLISAIDPTQSRFRIALYTIGTTAKQVVAPTYSVSTASSALDNDAKGLNSATSEVSSRFDSTLASVQNFVGTAGDGSTTSKPLKLVLLLTDGMISERDWVLNGVWWDSSGKMHSGTDWNKVAPLNPRWCSGMKANKVSVGVLYTEYLAIPTDEGYVHTVGDTMNSALWHSTWGGDIESGVSGSTSRRAYLPSALKDCASSSDLFLSAANSSDIESGLSTLFKSYLGFMRLTQ